MEVEVAVLGSGPQLIVLMVSLWTKSNIEPEAVICTTFLAALLPIKARGCHGYEYNFRFDFLNFFMAVCRTDPDCMRRQRSKLCCPCSVLLLQ